MITDEMVNKALDMLIEYGVLSMDTSIESDTAAVRAALEAAVGEMVRDAERWRYVRDDGLIWRATFLVSDPANTEVYTGAKADAVVDRALLAAANGEGG